MWKLLPQKQNKTEKKERKVYQALCCLLHHRKFKIWSWVLWCLRTSNKCMDVLGPRILVDLSPTSGVFVFFKSLLNWRAGIQRVNQRDVLWRVQPIQFCSDHIIAKDRRRVAAVLEKSFKCIHLSVLSEWNIFWSFFDRDGKKCNEQLLVCRPFTCGYVRCCCLVAKLCPTLCDPMAVAHQALLSMWFPMQEYWSGFSFASPGVMSIHSSKDPIDLLYRSCIWEYYLVEFMVDHHNLQNLSNFCGSQTDELSGDRKGTMTPCIL